MAFSTAVSDRINELVRIVAGIQGPLAKAGVAGVHGFGSFFRDGIWTDIDLLIIIRDNVVEPGRMHSHIQSLFKKLGETAGAMFHPIVLLESEFKQRLLNEHDSLVALYANEAA